MDQKMESENRRAEKLSKRLQHILLNATAAIEIDENAYHDLKDSVNLNDYHPGYIYSHFKAEHYFYSDLPDDIQINKFMCGDYFKGGFPENFECYEIFLDKYSRPLSDGFTCLICHVSEFYNEEFPNDFNCNFLHMDEAKIYHQLIPESANIEYIFINKNYYKLPLPDNYVLDEESTNKCASNDIIVFKNTEYNSDVLIDEFEEDDDIYSSSIPSYDEDFE